MVQKLDNAIKQSQPLRKETPYYGEGVIINPGELVEIEVEGKRGFARFYDVQTKKGTVRVFYTLGGELDFYHRSNDPDLSKAKKTCEALGIGSETILRNMPEHKDMVVVDKTEAKADATISTNGLPINLAPADCIGLVMIDNASGNIGISHAGRAGVGMNITKNFVSEFLQILKSKGETKYELTVILPPHIFGYEYPHDDNRFMEGEDNWWSIYPEFAPAVDGKYYPEIGPAVIRQLKDAVSEFDVDIDLKIIVSGLSTFQGHGVSHSIEKGNARNLVGVGYLTN